MPKAQNVDRLIRDVDASVVKLGQHGLHAHTIAERLGLSVGMVYSILSNAGVSLRDYRNGRNEYSAQLIEVTPVIKLNLVPTIGKLREAKRLRHRSRKGAPSA